MMVISITETPQFQTEPTKQQTKKVSALYYGLVKTDKMSVRNYVSQVFDHLLIIQISWLPGSTLFAKAGYKTEVL